MVPTYLPVYAHIEGIRWRDEQQLGRGTYQYVGVCLVTSKHYYYSVFYPVLRLIDPSFQITSINLLRNIPEYTVVRVSLLYY